MPILVPFPTVTPTEYVRGTMPALTLTRDDTTLHLNLANGWVILAGVEGLDDAPRTLIGVEPATWDGSLHISTRYQAREVFLPLHYRAATTDDLRSVTRALAALTDAKRGAVTLEVAHVDGTRRWTEGYLSAPFAAALSQSEGALWRQFGLTLRCDDPYWLGAARSVSFTIGGTPPEFLTDEFLPVGLADSQVAGDITITNTADAHAWPVWTLTGPCDSAEVTLGGLTWEVPAGLAEGEVLVVDTGRGTQTVEVDSVPAWGRLEQGAQFAVLAPGDNAVSVTATAATADTRLTVAWRERWLTAW